MIDYILPFLKKYLIRSEKLPYLVLFHEDFEPFSMGAFTFSVHVPVYYKRKHLHGSISTELIYILDDRGYTYGYRPRHLTYIEEIK